MSSRCGPKLFAAFVGGVVFAVVVPLLYVALGGLDLRQTTEPGGVERALARWTLGRTVATRAGNATNPGTPTAMTLERGLDHYRENCVVCHGAPRGIESGELAKGMQPKPPALDDASVQGLSDAQMFFITREGIRFTAMPAFGPTHEDAQIWQLISFVRHLPQLSDREASMLRGECPQTLHHHGEDE